MNSVNNNPGKSSLFKRLLPWLMAVLILVFLFYRIDRIMFLESLKKAEIFIYIPLVVLFILIWFFIETFNIKNLYQYFGHHLNYSSMLAVRGGTFLLMIINYGLGVGGIAMYVKKIKGVSLRRSTGILFYYMVVESGGIALLAVAGFLLAGNDSGIQNWVLYLGLGLFVFYNFEILVLKYIPPVGFLKRFVQSTILQPIRESTFRIFIRIFFQRIGYFITFIVFFYFALHAFHMQIPFVTLTALVPIIFFVGNLPITPFGLGTIQAAMLYFFKDYSTEANILAMSLVYSVSLIILRALIGFYYLRVVAKVISGSENILIKNDDLDIHEDGLAL